jgi:shikimate dehydrogenase
MNTPELFTIKDFLSDKAKENDFFAVLGRPISHSLSPLIHTFSLRKVGINSVYYPILVPEGAESLLSDLFRHPNFRGANVTIPLKQLVSGLVDEYSETVAKTGAANTVYRDEYGVLKAENTDVYGFLSPLQSLKSDLLGKSALIFGSGGASKAVIYALKSFGMAQIFVVSRTPSQLEHSDCKVVSYVDWPKYATQCSLIVNASPLGMYPNVEKSPVSEENTALLTGKICYDLIYRPLVTQFLSQAESQGAVVLDGLEMFIGQAQRAFELFTHKEFPLSEVRSLLKDHFNMERNVSEHDG